MNENQSASRIAVIGAGAVGSTLGALLHRTGYNVVLIARPEQVEAIRQNGLQVDGVMGNFIVPVEAAENLNFRPDIALLTVKVQDVIAAVKTNKAFLNDVPVVTFQNGIRADELAAEILPREQIFNAIVMLNASYLLPGKVTVAIRGGLTLGHPFNPKDDKLENIAHILNKTLPTRVTENIKGAQWLKLIVNMNNAIPAITNLTVSQVYDDTCLLRLVIGQMREGLRLIDQAKIRLESLPNFPVGLTRLIKWMPSSITARIAAAKFRRLAKTWPSRSSTLQSILRHRSTEINYLNGEIVTLGMRYGKATPLNTKIVELVHQVERTGQFLSREELRLALRL